MSALFLLRIIGWKRSFAIAIPIGILVVVATSRLGHAQRRLNEISADVVALNADFPDTKKSISTASRIDFWRKAIEFIEQAPLIGHGTGSTKSLYASLEAKRPSPYGEPVPDPHNQLLAIAVQTGLLGGVLFITMWIAHFSIFSGKGLPQLFGQAIVLQNVLKLSLFNSSLSQATEGTLYCLAVGLIGGLIVRQREDRIQSTSPIVDHFAGDTTINLVQRN